MREVTKIENLAVKIFADSADKNSMFDMHDRSYIKGLTTNPSLMRKAGIVDYRAFCKEILSVIKIKPISFEVFSDDFSEMERQAMELASFGENVYVKIPITNTQNIPSYRLIEKLVHRKIKLNITAIMTLSQVKEVVPCLEKNTPSYISVFAGRIADTGRDPLPIMTEAVSVLKSAPKAELIWASPRELLNIFQANAIGCHIITVTSDILKKLNLIGYDLDAYSLDTVRMFYDDAVLAGYAL